MYVTLGAGEEPRGSAQGHSPQGAFGGIVRQADASGIKERRKRLPAVGFLEYLVDHLGRLVVSGSFARSASNLSWRPPHQGMGQVLAGARRLPQPPQQPNPRAPVSAARSRARSFSRTCRRPVSEVSRSAEAGLKTIGPWTRNVAGIFAFLPARLQSSPSEGGNIALPVRELRSSVSKGGKFSAGSDMRGYQEPSSNTT